MGLNYKKDVLAGQQADSQVARAADSIISMQNWMLVQICLSLLERGVTNGFAGGGSRRFNNFHTELDLGPDLFVTNVPHFFGVLQEY